ncbi:MAG: SDR family oxidoreductase [Cyclobacteriaceae bacterium]
MTFDNKTFVIIGASSGIGNATAQKLIENGAEVYNFSRTPSSIEGIKNIQLDILADEFPEGSLPETVDGLIYCPGSIKLKPFQSLKNEDFNSDFEINVIGAVKAIKGSIKALRKSEKSSIVLFSTVAVSQGMSFHSSVAASKGAVEGLVKSLAAEFSKSKIRVNAIAPSLVDTPLASSFISSDEKRKTAEQRHPLSEIGEPKDIADAVCFLLSDSTKWMTGQVINIDGGLSSIKSL